MLENADTGNILTWAIGLVFTAAVLGGGFLNRKIDTVGTEANGKIDTLNDHLSRKIDAVDAKADGITKSHDAHVLLVEQTYAKAPAMKEGFEIAAKAAEKVAAALDVKLDKTQDAVQAIALEQAKQGENIKSMGNSIKDIALSIKEKSS